MHHIRNEIGNFMGEKARISMRRGPKVASTCVQLDGQRSNRAGKRYGCILRGRRGSRASTTLKLREQATDDARKDIARTTRRERRPTSFATPRAKPVACDRPSAFQHNYCAQPLRYLHRRSRPRCAFYTVDHRTNSLRKRGRFARVRRENHSSSQISRRLTMRCKSANGVGIDDERPFTNRNETHHNRFR